MTTLPHCEQRTTSRIARHVDVLRAVLRDSARAGRRAGLGRPAGPAGFGGTLAIVVLIAALAVFPVAHGLMRSSDCSVRICHGFGRLILFSQLWYNLVGRIGFAPVPLRQAHLTTDRSRARDSQQLDAADLPSQRQYPFQGQSFRRSFAGRRAHPVRDGARPLQLRDAGATSTSNSRSSSATCTTSPTTASTAGTAIRRSRRRRLPEFRRPRRA